MNSTFYRHQTLKGVPNAYDNNDNNSIFQNHTNTELIYWQQLTLSQCANLPLTIM